MVEEPVLGADARVDSLGYDEDARIQYAAGLTEDVSLGHDTCATGFSATKGGPKGPPSLLPNRVRRFGSRWENVRIQILIQHFVQHVEVRSVHHLVSGDIGHAAVWISNGVVP